MHVRWDQESIKGLINRSDEAVERAILHIYRNQTFDEQQCKDTRYVNNVGFSGHDAEYLTSIAEQLKEGRGLTDRQLAICRNKIRRYWKQLIPIIADKNRDKVVKQGKSYVIIDGAA